MTTSPLTTAIPVTTALATGGAGVATGTVTGTERLHGLLEGFAIDYGGSCPATTDLTITLIGDTNEGIPDIVATVISNTNTDGYFSVRHQQKDAAGAVIAGVFDRVPLLGHRIKVDLAQGDNNCFAKVTPVFHRGL